MVTVHSRTLVFFSVAFYLLLIAWLVFRVMVAADGHFVYALDDPYIHLALAENIAHGHYGINPTEFSSPSSSILWPLLLVPFAGTPLHVYVPLAWNILFGVLAASLLARAVNQWPPRRTGEAPMPFWQKAATVALLIFVANLPSLTLTGMEHVFQILLAICCALGMSYALSGRAMPWWCLLAAWIAPSVRYEDLTLTLAVSLALCGLRRWRAALALFGASLIPLAVFSAFLRSKGLPLLPMSVLAKGHAYGSASFPLKVFNLLNQSMHQDLTDAIRYPVLILFLIFAGLAWRAQAPARRFVFAGAAALGALQLTIGRFGWFHRYEIYAVIFLTLLLLRVLAERPPFSFGFFVMGLMFCAGTSIEAAAHTALAARVTWEQQYQMHRFVTGFYHGDYAVNDIGLVSFQRRPGAYVLDVYGLASAEAAQQPNKTAAWLAAIVKRHDTPLAILYPEWFHIPEAWTPLARLCVEDVATGVGAKCTVFYSTTPDGEAALRAELEQFSKTVPRQIGFYLAKPGVEGSMWRLVTNPTVTSPAP